MIPEPLREEVEAHAGTVRGAAPVGGGCISHASRLDAARGTFFLKHSGGEAGDTFEAEAAGLGFLAAAAADTGLGVPRVLHARDRTRALPGVILLEWIEPGPARRGYWERFGAALAALHRAAPATGDAAGPYGFDRDNFIGRLPQKNAWRATWPAFFRELRLGPQFDRARRGGHWRPGWDSRADRLLSRLEALLPERPHPSALHGDLWSGNQLADAQGRPWLVDPAAYAGDREADLAMTALFGGFEPGFYRAYDDAWPLEPGWEERREIYGLYHLVNHLNHFGGTYAGGVDRVLSRFGD